jgi:hypothetical protein
VCQRGVGGTIPCVVKRVEVRTKLPRLRDSLAVHRVEDRTSVVVRMGDRLPAVVPTGA